MGEIVSSISAPVPTESARFVHERRISHAVFMLTSFASFKFWAGYMRKALMATRFSPKSPFQISVSPPEATAIFPRFTSPTERMAEVGSCTIPLHKLPRAVRILAFCGSMVRYAFAERVDQILRRKEQANSTYLIELVYESLSLLWCQPQGVPHQILAAK